MVNKNYLLSFCIIRLHYVIILYCSDGIYMTLSVIFPLRRPYFDEFGYFSHILDIHKMTISKQKLHPS